MAPAELEKEPEEDLKAKRKTAGAEPGRRKMPE
jgi:hypothetical protein